jgi:hypothetical protein
VLACRTWSEAAEAAAIPRVLVLTGVMIVLGVSAAAFFRGLKAPRTRGLSLFGMLLAFLSAALAVRSSLAGEADLPRGVLALAAFTGGVAHTAYFGYAAMLSAWHIPRTAVAGMGVLAGTAVAIALLRPAWSWLVPIAVSLAVTVVGMWAWAFSQGAPGRVKVGGRWVTSVRFPCPRCGVVADWAEGASPCPECGLFVHIEWDPGEEEAARSAPAEPDPTRTARFACPGCGSVGDWAHDVAACGACGKRLRMHWNVHAGA